eukprot:TRINITY_DN3229_c0_g1_i3.p1 TRINITY_DN3229_c0_g1~~TRINITY_DN3229_c0_g1_i3.p1  ORF type:complete len:687 (+),score=141.68 TRINITY_DN3229_c0_g1_i3:16-2076(+)
MSGFNLQELTGIRVPTTDGEGSSADAPSVIDEEKFGVDETLPLKGVRVSHRDLLTLCESVEGRSIAPVRLEFKNISLSIPIGKPKKGQPIVQKQILRDISGWANPGEVLAIMGPSGSGKTSLLSVLSGRAAANAHIEGSVTVNGEKVTKAFMKRSAGYVLQDDLLLAHQTVRETIEFSAKLRLVGMSASERAKRVEEVIGELGLRKVENTFIGNEIKRGISGGERKRVSVALEVMRDVSVLFLDEPTSGLDSFVAYNTIEVLKMLAQKHQMTIICTIHQPRSQIWKMFDKLLLLSDGKTMFFGPSRDVIPFFSNAGFPCPTHFNPADFFLDLVAIDYRSSTKEKETIGRVQKIADVYVHEKEKLLGPDMKEDIPIDEADLINQPRSPSHFEIPPKSSFIVQLAALLHRVFIERIRDKIATLFRWVSQVFVALIIGWVYFDLGTDQASIQNRAGLLFFVIVQQGFALSQTVVDRFPAERVIFARENGGGFYGSTAYYLSKNIAELPISFFITISYGSIMYWMTGLQSDAGKFFIFLLTMVGTAFSAEGVGFFISTISPNVMIANLLTPIILITFLLLSGFYANISTIPKFFIWLEYISFMRYGYSAIMTNEFTGLTLYCTSSEYATNSQGQLECPITSGEQVLVNRDLNSPSLAWDIALLFIVGFSYRLVGYLLFRMGKIKSGQLPP